MNEAVKTQVTKLLDDMGMSQRDFAKMTNMYESSLSRLLHGEHNGLSNAWKRVLEALDLELIAVPKKNLSDIESLLKDKNEQK